MKKILIVLALAAMFASNCSTDKAQTENTAAVKYGEELTVSDMTMISAIVENPSEFDGKKVLVEGRILQVCEMKGCWMEIAGEKELTQIRVKVDDGVITFPMTAIGQTAKVEGVFAVTTQTIEMQMEQGQKHAKETGEEFDASKVTGPKVTYQLNVTGAVISQ